MSRPIGLHTSAFTIRWNDAGALQRPNGLTWRPHCRPVVIVSLRGHKQLSTKYSYTHNSVSPFQFWSNLSDSPVLNQYTGSRFLVYNSSSKCAKSIEKPDQIYIDEESTQENYMDQGLDLWNQRSGDPYFNLTLLDKPKMTLAGNYIYCWPKIIRIIDSESYHDYDCRPYPFRLSLDVPFSTTNKAYTPTIRRKNFMSNQKAPVFTKHLGNFDRLLDEVDTSNSLKSNRILKQKLDTYKSMDIISLVAVNTTSWNIIVTLSVIGILLLIILVFCSVMYVRYLIKFYLI